MKQKRFDHKDWESHLADTECQSLGADQLITADICREPIAPGSFGRHSAGRGVPAFVMPVEFRYDFEPFYQLTLSHEMRGIRQFAK
jgi:hypothetical protein